MSHIKIYLLSLILCFAYIFKVHGQSYYEFVHNASGIIVESEDQEQIDQAVQSLINVLPENIQSNFKVYTADFYIHQQTYPGSYPEVFINIVNELSSPYYVFIAKGIVTAGDVAEWYVALSLPEEGDFECLSATDRQLLINLLNVTSNQYRVGTGSHALGITSALTKLTYYIKVIVDCNCDFSDPNCAKTLFERNDDYLLGMGFRKRKVDIGPARIWVNGTAGIFDFTSEKSSLIIDGKEYYIPEEVYDNKVLLDNGNFVEEDDEFTVDFTGRVYIFDESSFKGGSNEQAWFDAFNISTTEDYVEYWVLLQDDKSKIWYLYSRYTLGPIVPAGHAIWDAEEEARSVSPLSLLLKFTMNAVIDIMIESTANYIFESNIDNWDKAFKSVNYTRIAADALYSLIPWKEPHKKYEILGRTLIGGVGRVLDKSKNNSNYSVQEGFEDFVVGCGTGALVVIVTEKVKNLYQANRLFLGLMKVVSKSNNTKLNSIFARCFSTELMSYGCFVSTTGIYVAKCTQRKISDLDLHDIVLSKFDRQLVSEIHSLNRISSFAKFSGSKSNNFAVTFQSSDERHRCQLSLDDVALVDYGIQDVGDLVWLSIADQGIEGIYVVTDIRSIKPPKIPSGDELDGDVRYSYITGIYQHTSDDVWKLIFENGEEIEVTGSHPFYDVRANGWKPVSWLEPGDELQSKVGTAILLAREKLEGEHQVYNITVAGTHTYFVGDVGLWVHNSCGTIAELDLLATKFINNLNATIKKAEIAEWWAKGYPKFFQRGTFFERLMAKSGRYSGWTITPHNWPVIDFQKIIGGKVKVVSMKTTITTDVTSWMSTNADHLVKLNNMKVSLAKDVGNIPEIRALHVYVKKSALANYSNWAAAIKAKYPDIKEVLISSIEDEFSL
jgi:hypothetical protein